GELLASVIGQGEEVEGVTAILLLTDEDHFNALAAITIAGGSNTPVYRLPPCDPSQGTAPYATGQTLFSTRPPHPRLTSRFTSGPRINTREANGGIPRTTDLLFLINGKGTVIPVTTSHRPDPQPGDTLILLCPSEDETAG